MADSGSQVSGIGPLTSESSSGRARAGEDSIAQVTQNVLCDDGLLDHGEAADLGASVGADASASYTFEVGPENRS